MQFINDKTLRVHLRPVCALLYTPRVADEFEFLPRALPFFFLRARLRFESGAQCARHIRATPFLKSHISPTITVEV